LNFNLKGEDKWKKMKWLITKLWKRLTEPEVKAELENLLRNCEDESQFEKECRQRKGFRSRVLIS